MSDIYPAISLAPEAPPGYDIDKLRLKFGSPKILLIAADCQVVVGCQKANLKETSSLTKLFLIDVLLSTSLALLLLLARIRAAPRTTLSHPVQQPNQAAQKKANRIFSALLTDRVQGFSERSAGQLAAP